MTLRQFSCGFLVVILACGGKDGGIDSGLPPDKTGDDLVPAEQQSLCEATAEYLDAHISAEEWTGYMCTLEGFGSGEATDLAGRIEECEQARAACIAAGEQEALGGFCDDDIDWTMCGATIAEIETCLTDAIDLLDSIIGDFSCDVLDPAKAQALQDKYGDKIEDPYPDSCDVVRAKCPQVIGAGSDAEPIEVNR